MMNGSRFMAGGTDSKCGGDFVNWDGLSMCPPVHLLLGSGPGGLVWSSAPKRKRRKSKVICKRNTKISAFIHIPKTD